MTHKPATALPQKSARNHSSINWPNMRPFRLFLFWIAFRVFDPLESWWRWEREESVISCVLAFTFFALCLILAWLIGGMLCHSLTCS